MTQHKTSVLSNHVQIYFYFGFWCGFLGSVSCVTGCTFSSQAFAHRQTRPAARCLHASCDRGEWTFVRDAACMYQIHVLTAYIPVCLSATLQPHLQNCAYPAWSLSCRRLCSRFWGWCVPPGGERGCEVGARGVGRHGRLQWPAMYVFFFQSNIGQGSQSSP